MTPRDLTLVTHMPEASTLVKHFSLAMTQQSWTGGTALIGGQPLVLFTTLPIHPYKQYTAVSYYGCLYSGGARLSRGLN